MRASYKLRYSCTLLLQKKEKVENQIKTSKLNHVEEKNNNVPVNGATQPSKKRKIENEVIKKTKNNTVPNTKKKKTEDEYEIPETENFDEILLNAKKKKFNAVIENDAKEDLLFSEQKQITQKKNKLKKILNNISINDKSTERVTNINNDISESIPVNPKKAKLRSLLESSSHRNSINVSKTGNKLRDRMLERLKAAQFRYLNEKLYTSSGSEAQQLFQSDPAAFQTYHQGYQLQVKKWPVNPLDVIVKKIMKMPKTHLIADLGCGEAALSRRVPHKVRSFDLVASAPGVEACDMARTPLLSASMDVTVYCLALMGTDLTQYLVEANRVLKMGGHLLIAEVESRFDKVEDFAKEVERLGFKLKQLDKSNKVFFFMEFSKIRDPPVKKAKLPALTLKPCLYKRR
ncbi:ribosomal RNA-processing protein 8 [Helicoverpa armigera]|uniref:ribosomal RNA-processing protein 8 n=1 Tax=Helicoverpa armigera TaxID=29058 RepID=UPI0030828E21